MFGASLGKGGVRSRDSGLGEEASEFPGIWYHLGGGGSAAGPGLDEEHPTQLSAKVGALTVGRELSPELGFGACCVRGTLGKCLQMVSFGLGLSCSLCLPKHWHCVSVELLWDLMAKAGAWGRQPSLKSLYLLIHRRRECFPLPQRVAGDKGAPLPALTCRHLCKQCCPAVGGRSVQTSLCACLGF